MKTRTKKIGFIRVGLTFFICLGIMVVLSLIALRIGSVEYSTSEIISALMDPTSTTYTIIVNLRLPRVILAILVGMCLAASGTLLQAVMQNRADYGRRWYRVGKREMAVYEALKIKRWKRRMPTYDNALFNPQLHSWDEIAQAMCQAELVHETIVVLSFLPIAGGIWFGAYPVFIITSVLAAGYDLLFVMMQRYNRQRVLMLPARKSTSPGRTTQTAG